MNDKAGINLTGKDAAKLLEGLTKDPQLRSEDDPSILAEEQFPTNHHALLQGKIPTPVCTTLYYVEQL